MNTVKAKRKTSAWLAVTAIALGAFSLVIAEFLPIGLLPEISRDLGVSEGRAGLMVTGTSLLAALGAPVTTMAIGRLDRRLVLMGLTFLQIVSSVLSVCSPNFALMLLARVFLGLGVGGFWAIAIASGARLVPEDKVARAVALVSAGISAATVISVPAGNFIGAHFNWRIAFAASGVLALVVLLLQWIWLPKLPMKKAMIPADFFSVLRNPSMQVVLIYTLFAFSGHFAGYTFVTPFLEQIAKVGPAALGLLMLGYGIMGILGNIIGGASAGRNLRGTHLGTMALFSIALLFMALLGGQSVFAGSMLLLWAFAFGMIPLCTQLWTQVSSPEAPEAAQAMITTVSQLAISGGSLLGGFVVDHIELNATMWLGDILGILAFGTVLLFGKRRRKPKTGLSS